MKAQVSIEFLIVVGLGIGIVSLFVIYGYSALYSYKVSSEVSLIKNSLEKIGKTAEFVCYQGEPARQEISVCFPLNLKNCNLTGKTISCHLHGGKQIYYDSEVNLNGSMPNSSGCWDLSLEAQNGFVNITVK